MLVSNCCGAKFHDMETKICRCCNEHADMMVMVGDEPSTHEPDLKKYNHTSYRNGVVMAMIDKYGSRDNAIFEMQKALESAEGKESNLKKVITRYRK